MFFSNRGLLYSSDQEAPSSVSIVGQLTVLSGGSTMLNCTATGGAPPPSLKWTINPGVSSTQAQYTILSNGSLFLMNIPAGEDTQYCCQAYNEFGVTTETCDQLTVNCELDFSQGRRGRYGSGQLIVM